VVRAETLGLNDEVELMVLELVGSVVVELLVVLSELDVDEETSRGVPWM